MHKQGIARAITSFTSKEIRKLIYQARPVYTGNGLDIKVMPIKETFARILIVTPRKIGSAPQRNLLKRRIKSLFYEEKYYEQPFCVVVFCKKGSADLSFDQLKGILQGIYEELKKRIST